MALSNMQKQQAFRDRKKATPLAEALFDGAMNMTRNTFLETMEFDGNRFHEYLNDCEFSETQEFQDERDEIYRAAYEKAYTDRYSELYEERYPEAFEECYAKIRANDSDIDDVDPYHIVNLYLGVREEQWNVELYATNLFDEEALRAGGGTEATPLLRREPTGYGQRFLVAGRRIGLAASYRW